MLNKLFTKHKSLLLYGVLGGMGALSDLLVYLLLIHATPIQPSAATFISVSAGILVSFILNSRLNFKKTDQYLLRFLTFYVVGVIGAFLSALIILILFNGLHWDARLAKIISIPPVVLAQFWINKKISFSDNPHLFWKAVLAFIKREWLPLLVFAFATTVFILSSFNAITVDDMDNLLSGKLITEGLLPYRDFFSHHTPGMYFISAILYPFVSQSIFVYRLVFNIIMLALLGITYVVARRYMSKEAALVFVFLISCAHSIAFMHVPLAESVLSILIPLALIMVFFDARKAVDFKKTTLISILLFFVPFLSLGYAITILPIYMYLFYLLISTFALRGRVLISHLAIIAAPYCIAFILLILTGSLSEARYDLFTFNQQFYGPMSGEAIHSPLAMLSHTALESLRQIVTVLSHAFDYTYVLRLLLIIAFVTPAIVYFVRKKYVEGVTILSLLLLANTRSNIFNPAAISSPINQVAQHGAVYIALSILMVSFSVYLVLSELAKRRITHVAGVIVVVILSVSLLQISAHNITGAFSEQSKTNYLTYSREIKDSTFVKVANTITSSDDGAWIAPQGFAEQIFIKAKNPTKYTFYFPWLDASPKIRGELTAELIATKPMLMYIDFTQYKPLKNINLRNIVQSSYFQVSDSRLQNYYFLSEDQFNIKKELASHGYEVK